jgi:hypothetical protein
MFYGLDSKLYLTNIKILNIIEFSINQYKE